MKDKQLEEFARDTGLKFDETTGTAFGSYGGYHVCLEPTPSNRSIFNIHFSVARGGSQPDKEEFKPLTKSCRQINACRTVGHGVVVTAKPNGWSRKKSLDNAKLAMEEAAAYLRQNGYNDCCQHCGREEYTDTYLINGSYMHLCSSCFSTMNVQTSQQQYEEEQKTENVIGGIVGALLGSLLGVLAMVVVAQLGYVSAISGIVLGVCTLYGYEKLGGKLTKKGIFLSVVIMILMVYFGNRLTWAISAASELKDYLDMNVFEYFRYLPDLLDMADARGEYIGSLAQQYLFTALGAIPTVIATGKNKKLKNTVHRLGRDE